MLTSRPTRRWFRSIGCVAIALTTSAVIDPTTSAAPTHDEPVGTVPLRLLDTRPGFETVDGTFAGIGRRAADTTLELIIGGRAGIAATLDIAVFNVTVVNPSGPGFLTVYPCHDERPNASNINFAQGDVIANSVTTEMSGDDVCIYTSTATHIVVDVNSTLVEDGTLLSSGPSRQLDTRPGFETADGQFAGIGQRPAGSVLTVPIRAGSVDRESVVMNVAAVNPTAPGFLTVYPCDADRPNASNLNYGPGDVIANSVTVKLSSTDTVCIYTHAPTHIIADITAWVPTDGSPTTVIPARLLETRPGLATVDGEFQGAGQRAADSTTVVQIGGRGGVPRDVDSVLLNVAAVSPTAPGFLTVYPCDADRPNASNLNYGPGDVIANSVTVKLSSTDTVCIYTHAPTHIIADVTGYVTGQSTLERLSSSRSHSCLVRADRSLVCWGDNTHGQLGAGDTDHHTAPVVATVIDDVSDVSTAETSTCAITGPQGRTACWGQNNVGQLAVAADETPQSLTALEGHASYYERRLVSGGWHHCELSRVPIARGAECWGLNSSGQVSDVLAEPVVDYMVRPALPRHPIDIAAGSAHSCALLSDRTVRCWGRNTQGQLGNGTFDDVGFAEVVGITEGARVFAGDQQSCALLTDGRVWCWGRLEPGTNDPIAVEVPALRDVRFIAFSETHACALRDSGTVACWGSNTSGQLGHSNSLNNYKPADVAGIRDAIAVSAGNGFSCALLRDERALCWGSNVWGQLGDGTTTASSTPVVVDLPT